VRTYEALYIVRPDAADDEVQTIANQVESLVTDSGGAIVRSEIWGKRKLAYEVNHCAEGNYVLQRFECEPGFPKQLENHFKYLDSVIRYLLVYYDEHDLRLEAEQQKRREAEISRGAEGEDRDRPRRRRDEDEDDGPRRRREDDDDRPRRRRDEED
jgi:small subunit ribosomal protein S6